MNRLLKHFRLRRVAGTELRVVSDMESGLGPLIDIEEEVIEKYAATPRWRQEVVTLFVLKDLEPLVRQLSEEAALPPGGLTVLGQRPIVNVYDLESPGSCHVFINQRAMEKEGYWDDREAVKGLLAHEHAHPLSECETTQSARRLQVDLSSDGVQPLFPSQAQEKEWQTKVERLLAVVVDKLCLYAPREVFANDVAIQSNFTAPLLYLDKKNVLGAAKGVRSKGALRQRLQEEVERASLTPAGADLLLVIADMHGHLDLAMETASFYRQDKVTEAEELEEMLFAGVMPYLEPPVAEAYPRLRDQYVQLPQDASPEELVQFEKSLLGVLAAVLKEKGLRLEYNLRVAP
jgi:hypothetical protein